jgi:arabinose-5-phosphate isomerase
MEISEKRLGVTAVVADNQIIGIITDGDIRRMLNKTETITGITAKDIMTVNAKSIKSTDLVSEALDVLENFAITQLAVIDNGTYKGIIHLHDILKEGVI